MYDLKNRVKRISIVCIVIVLFVLLLGGLPRKSATGDQPSKQEMDRAIHAKVADADSDYLRVIVHGDEGDIFYTFLFDECDLHIERDLLRKDYPIIVIPSKDVDGSDISFSAVKIYGYTN